MRHSSSMRTPAESFGTAQCCWRRPWSWCSHILFVVLVSWSLAQVGMKGLWGDSATANLKAQCTPVLCGFVLTFFLLDSSFILAVCGFCFRHRPCWPFSCGTRRESHVSDRLGVLSTVTQQQHQRNTLRPSNCRQGSANRGRIGPSGGSCSSGLVPARRWRVRRDNVSGLSR